MARANDEAEALLYEYSDLLSILSEDRFKPRAYEKAARSVGGYHADIREFDLKGLMAIPNVGRSIAEKIHEYLETGEIGDLEALRGQIPEGVRRLTSVPGLGPKKAFRLFEELGIDSTDALEAAANSHALAGLKGFGKATEESILRGLRSMSNAPGRVGIGVAMDLGRSVVDGLRGLEEVEGIEVAGSLRRMCETIGDVDILVAGTDAGPVMEAFTGMSLVARTLAKGETKSSVVTSNGIQIDLRVIPPDSWGAALQYFTGSKGHNVRIRAIAVRKGLKLSEYGLFGAKPGRLIVSRDEEEVYAKLGLPWIPPTLREDRGEVEAALGGELPVVVKQSDVKGDLHTHTDLTDGVSTLEKMLETASGLGYRYYAVTDHAPQLYMQRMTDEKMLAQRKRLRALQKDFPRMELLHGTELNIDEEGKVDWPPEFLESFDVTVASIHSHFNDPKDRITKRLIRAMENPHVNVIGHPTGRILGKREAYEFDYDEVFRVAARTGTALEINGYPDRLDLKDEHIMWARRLGVKFAIDTDSHATVHLDFMKYGVATAQRGWLEKDDVINTWPPSKLRKFLLKGRG